MKAHIRKFARIATASGGSGKIIFMNGVLVAAGAAALNQGSRTVRRQLAKATRRQAKQGGAK